MVWLELSKVTTTAVRAVKHPRIQTELRSFKGPWNIPRCFCPDFSRVAALFEKKLQIDQPTSLLSVTLAEKDAVENLGTLLTNLKILACPRLTDQWLVYNEEYDCQEGRVILQPQEVVASRPIGHWWGTLTSADQRLVATHEEFLTVV